MRKKFSKGSLVFNMRHIKQNFENNRNLKQQQTEIQIKNQHQINQANHKESRNNNKKDKQ